jgi:hypothetical protein
MKGITLEGSPADRKVARALATMASDTTITYVPTGYVSRDRTAVWHEMKATEVATGKTWLYYLRRDHGSYAGGWYS